MRNCTAAVARAANSDFTIEQVMLEAPRHGEVLVRIAGVGLCHTDLVFRDQIASFAKPAVFGHEGSGVIEALGEGVEGLAVGDQVVIGFSSCGDCPRCTEQLPTYCVQFPALNYAGFRLEDGSSAIACDGERISSHFFGQSSFATHAIARAGNIVKLPKETPLPLELLGPLGCGLMTGAGSVMNSMDCQPSSSLLIFGGGPVGLAAVMAGKIRKCSTIILVEPMESRRQMAMELGATHTLDPFADPVAEAIRRIVPTGVNAALDTSGVVAMIEAGLACLASHGVIGLVGVPKEAGTTVSFSIGQLMTFGHRVIGIIEGDSVPQQFIPELLRHYAAGEFPFDRLIRLFPLDQINDAVAAQAKGECIKAVLVPR